MIVWISIGGVIGAVSRYYIGRWISGRVRTFPAGTLIVNVTGSFLLGVIFALQIRQAISEQLWYLLGIGLCGAYTTFSTFGYETVQMIENKRWTAAVSYVLASVAFGLLAAWLGMEMYA